MTDFFPFDLSTQQATVAKKYERRRAGVKEEEMVFYRMINALPGSQGFKVFVGTSSIMGFAGLTFFGAQRKSAGHNAFDVDKPEVVSKSMEDAIERNRQDRFKIDAGKRIQ